MVHFVMLQPGSSFSVSDNYRYGKLEEVAHALCGVLKSAKHELISVTIADIASFSSRRNNDSRLVQSRYLLPPVIEILPIPALFEQYNLVHHLLDFAAKCYSKMREVMM